MQCGVFHTAKVPLSRARAAHFLKHAGSTNTKMYVSNAYFDTRATLMMPRRSSPQEIVVAIVKTSCMTVAYKKRKSQAQSV